MTETAKKRVDPVNTRKVGGEFRRERYTFDRVHVDDIPGDFSQSNVDFEKGVDRVKWEYDGKCPILIDADGVMAREGAPRKEAQNQAFFALSILAEEGYVSRWSKQ